MENKKILIYPGGEIKKALEIKQILDSNYTVSILTDDALDKTLKEVMNTQNYSSSVNGSTFDFDAMILPAIDQEELHTIIKTLKDHEIDIERKALLTKHNQTWTINSLLNEINTEHTYYQKRNDLHQLFVSATKIDPKDIDKNIAPIFQKAVLDTYELLQNKQCSLEDIENSLNQLSSVHEKTKHGN